MITRPIRLAALDIGSLTVRLGIAGFRPPAQRPGCSIARNTLPGQIFHRLHSLLQASRSRLPGLSAAKADVINPGAAIILEILRFFSAAQVTVIDAGLLEGVLERLPHRVLAGQL